MGDQEARFVSSGAKDPLKYSDPCGFGEAPDVGGFAALSGNKALTVLIYNHHDDWNLHGETTVDLTIERLPFDAPELRIEHYRIDHAHSNAYAEWLRQGKPMYPAPGQYAAIKARDGLELLEPPRTITPDGGNITLSFSMPVHAVSLLVVAPA
jgi:xylan 1,4-beta-xylosidase